MCVCVCVCVCVVCVCMCVLLVTLSILTLSHTHTHTHTHTHKQLCVVVTYDMLFPDKMRVVREGTSISSGGNSMNLLKANTSVASCLRSTRPRGREVSRFEWRRRVVRLRRERERERGR